MFGFERMAAALVDAPAAVRLDRVVEAVSAHMGGLSARDDISIMLVNCRREAALIEHPQHAVPVAATADAGHWRFNLRLGATEVRKLDVVPLLLGLANQFDGARDRSGELFVILSELFNNALDHGLLRLDSRKKLEPEGMERYLDEREARLAALREGEIELEIELFELDDTGWLRIVCRDTGPGFDQTAVSAAAPESSELPFGRGLALVRSMTASCEINDIGNTVTAILALTPGRRWGY
jgi:anti-sigma regulatory factor (Ser/Thr protein kinase)